MSGLSVRDREALIVLHEFERMGVSPSVRELRQAWGIVSMESYYTQVRRLEAAGYVQRGAPGTRRQISLIKLPPDFHACPHCGVGGLPDKQAEEARSKIAELAQRKSRGN